MPYCNVITVNVAQVGGTYQLDGFDDQCGASTRASATGLAFPNPDGTIGFGLTIVTSPGGTPLHVDAAINLATISGTWRDSAGGTGAFTFTPGAAIAGSPRPAPRMVFPAGLSIGGATISNLAAPVAATDAATKGYVDAGLSAKAALPTVALVTYSGTTTLSEPSGLFVKLRDIGTFTKTASSPSVRLTLQTHVSMTVAGTSCAFQLRVDDLHSSGASGGFNGTEAIINSANRNAVTMVAVFDALSTGSHTLSLWIRGAGVPTCQDNAGNFVRSVLVEQ